VDRFEGVVAVDLQDIEKMESTILWSTRGEVSPSVLRPKQTTKSYEEQHVYVIMHVIEYVDKFLVT